MIKKYGFAFAGGGIKSLSQLAVLKYLEENNIKPYAVSGTSAGSLVAALVAMGLNTEEILSEIEDALIEIEKHKVFKVSGKELLFNKDLKHGFLDGIKVEQILDGICEKHNIKHISEVKMPLAITAVDLFTGELIVFVSHPNLYHNTHDRTRVIKDISLSKAIRASMSFPLVFGSMDFEDYALIDGGVRMNCPVPMLRDYGVDKTFAITMRDETTDASHIKKTVEVAARVFEIISTEAEKIYAHSADFLLNIPVGSPNIFDTKIAELIIKKGEIAVGENRLEIDAFFTEKKSFFDKLFGK